ncbi:MAG: hypothetical protein AAF661_07675 [Pseudomonadota bacterium]
MQFDALFDDYGPEETAPQPTPRSLTPLELSEIPEAHPVRRFAEIHQRMSHGPLLPNGADLLSDEDTKQFLQYAKLFEPVDLDGYVDFRLLWVGDRTAAREKRSHKDQWLSETIDPEFYDAHYHEIVAVSILRRSTFSRGEAPSLERAFIKVIRGVFPIFAENQPRLRLIEISAEPYLEMS